MIALTVPPLTVAVAVAVALTGRMGELGIGKRSGAWLTCVTVIGKVCTNTFWPPLAVPPLFITVSVILAVP